MQLTATPEFRVIGAGRPDRVDVLVDVTAPTVATVRAAIFNELLASEANTATAARAGANIDLCKIKKFHIVSLTPAIGRLN